MARDVMYLCIYLKEAKDSSHIFLEACRHALNQTDMEMWLVSFIMSILCTGKYIYITYNKLNSEHCCCCNRATIMNSLFPVVRPGEFISTLLTG